MKGGEMRRGMGMTEPRGRERWTGRRGREVR